jgi:hypothetical protein
MSAGAQPSDEAEIPPPWDLSAPQAGDGPLSAYARSVAAAPAYLASPTWRGAYLQVAAQQQARLGAHQGALADWDAAMGRRQDSVGVVPHGVRAVDAAAYLAARAADEQVVMINEAHHDTATRLLTLRLLPLLYERGYRYVAAETFAPGVAEATANGYPTAAAGVYADEPVFGAILREALRLGYALVPYEIEDGNRVQDDSLTAQQRRDLTQAQHIAARIFAADPDAKVLVHAGFGHVEERIGSFYPMAVYFREITGIDPLTVDQTVLAARSEPAFEHPLRRGADQDSLIGDSPVILIDADGQPLAPVRYTVDVQVLPPRTVRASLALPNRHLAQLDVPAACAESPCLVEVHPATEPREAVPLDRLIADRAGPVAVAVAGEAVARILAGETGEVLVEQPLPAE